MIAAAPTPFLPHSNSWRKGELEGWTLVGRSEITTCGLGLGLFSVLFALEEAVRICEVEELIRPLGVLRVGDGQLTFR